VCILTSSRYGRAPDTAETTPWLGAFLLVAFSILAAVALVLSLLYAADFGGWRDSPQAAAASPPKPSPLARSYLAIAGPANHQLDVDVDAFTRNESGDLAAARSDLRAEAATARAFDKSLAGIKFPPAIAAVARALIQANQSRARLISRQARSTTLRSMRSFNGRHRAADAAVEVQVRLIRQALHLPAPSDS